MKKVFIKLILCSAIFSFSAGINAQQKKNYDKIMTSTSITEIEDFLQNSHPDDPRRLPLKRKLVTLKNEEWTKGAKSARPMPARPIDLEPDKGFSAQTVTPPDESVEFKKLMAESQSSRAHNDMTVKLLNTLFDQDVSSKEAILLVQNNSECNMIIRIKGQNSYNLAVPSFDENSIVLPKGKYQFTGFLCGFRYVSEKNIEKGTIVILNKPVEIKK